MADFDGLALYQYGGCSFCTRVRSFVAEVGQTLEIRDVMDDPDYLAELVAATGRRMVPCLRIESPDGSAEWLHESADIIDFLRRRSQEA